MLHTAMKKTMTDKLRMAKRMAFDTADFFIDNLLKDFRNNNV
jgi:hypothetical protein